MSSVQALWGGEALGTIAVDVANAVPVAALARLPVPPSVAPRLIASAASWHLHTHVHMRHI